MITEVLRGIEALKAVTGSNPRTLALMEGPTNCNRTCSYCTVPKRWNPEESSTVGEACEQIIQ